MSIKGLQSVVQQSTVCPSGSEALRSQTWLCKIDARNCVEWVITEYLNVISCVDFAKPCLASQSSWARRANCGLLHYWLDPFNWYIAHLDDRPQNWTTSNDCSRFPLQTYFAKPEVSLQNDACKFILIKWLINLCCYLRYVFRSNSWICKAHKPEGQL